MISVIKLQCNSLHFLRKYKTALTQNECSVILKELERVEEHSYSAGGWLSSSKGGDQHAHYFNKCAESLPPQSND